MDNRTRKAKKNKQGATTEKVAEATKSVKKKDSAERKKTKMQIDKMKALALLVKEIIETGLPHHKNAKPSSDHPGVKSAVNIVKGLNSANCKIEYYLSAYKKIYDDNKKNVLSSFSELYWMTEIIVKAHLGDPKHGACLHLSMAMNSAMKMRNAIEEKKYNNPNDKEEALGGYKYGYVTLLHFRFLDVVIEALGDDHKDITRVQNLCNKFKAETHLNSDESSGEESGEDKPSIGKTVTKLSGEKHSTKGIEKAVNSMVGNAAAFESVKNAVKDMGATEGNPLENTELLTKTVTSIAPLFKGIFENMSEAHRGEGSTESSSDDDDEDDEVKESESSD